LVKANKISDLDFFERMDYPNAREMAKNLYLQATKPELLYPDVVKEIQENAQKEADQGTDRQQPILPQEPPEQLAGGLSAPQPPFPQSSSGGTEHTQALLQGNQVAPFEGIDPAQYPLHLSTELQFMGSQEFTQIPEQLQALYAQHVMAERKALNDRQIRQPVPGQVETG